MPAMSARVEEFYNHVHDHATGRFSGRAASGREGFRDGSHSVPAGHSTRKVAMVDGKHAAVKSEATPENFPRGDGRKGPVHASGTVGKRYQAMKTKNGKPVVGEPKPLRDATTGRINPTRVRAAFKQDQARSAGVKTPGAKRTSGNFKGTVAGKHVAVTTTGTYRGRTIKHNASTGHSPRYSKLGPLAMKFIQHRPKGIGKGAAKHTKTSVGPTTNSPAYKAMKAREARQAALAQTNRARANHGMPPISN